MKLWSLSAVSSLLKVHLQVRGFSVFIDVEKLEAGKFEEKLIQSVQRARNFILVLSANALDKCMGDEAMKDWVHKVWPVSGHAALFRLSCRSQSPTVVGCSVTHRKSSWH